MQIDMTRPNPARILDYWMGGVHNFEIDRQLGDQVSQMIPIIVQMQRDGRTLLKRVVRHMLKDLRVCVLLDFGAGLPTCENTHLVAAEIDPTVRVLYSDIDPLTVAYGREILQDNPQVLYLEGAAQEPLAILENEASQTFLRGERRAGIIYIALAHFMNDDQIRRAAHALYEWAAPGSHWFITHAPPEWDTNPEMAGAPGLYRKASITLYLRTPQEFVSLLAPWQLAPGGLTQNLQWGLTTPDANAQLHPFIYEVMVYRP